MLPAEWVNIIGNLEKTVERLKEQEGDSPREYYDISFDWEELGWRILNCDDTFGIIVNLEKTIGKLKEQADRDNYQRAYCDIPFDWEDLQWRIVDCDDVCDFDPDESDYEIPALFETGCYNNRHQCWVIIGIQLTVHIFKTIEISYDSDFNPTIKNLPVGAAVWDGYNWYKEPAEIEKHVYVENWVSDPICKED